MRQQLLWTWQQAFLEARVRSGGVLNFFINWGANFYFPHQAGRRQGFKILCTRTAVRLKFRLYEGDFPAVFFVCVLSVYLYGHVDVWCYAFVHIHGRTRIRIDTIQTWFLVIFICCCSRTQIPQQLNEGSIFLCMDFSYVMPPIPQVTISKRGYMSPREDWKGGDIWWHCCALDVCIYVPVYVYLYTRIHEWLFVYVYTYRGGVYAWHHMSCIESWYFFLLDVVSVWLFVAVAYHDRCDLCMYVCA